MPRSFAHNFRMRTRVNAAHELHRLDEPLFESLFTTHPSGLRVLAAPVEPAFADDISTVAMIEIITKLRGMFDYVIVDTASLHDELALSLLECADQVLHVFDMDLFSVKNAKPALNIFRLMYLPASKRHLILNRSSADSGVDRNEIEQPTEQKSPRRGGGSVAARGWCDDCSFSSCVVAVRRWHRHRDPGTVGRRECRSGDGGAQRGVRRRCPACRRDRCSFEGGHRWTSRGIPARAGVETVTPPRQWR